MQKISIILFASLLAASSFVVAANNDDAKSQTGGKKIVKWVDSKGVTQYGDKLPASEAGRNNAEMNTQGIVLKHNISIDKKTEVLDQQKLEKERKDKVLLDSYTSAEEIDLARDRNLQLDQAALQALTQQKINIAGRTARNNKTADSIRARKKPLPAYLVDELKLSKTEIANVDKQLAQRNLSMAATRAHYAEAKARFTALKQPTPVIDAAKSSDVSTNAVETPAAYMKTTSSNNAAITTPTGKTAVKSK